MTTNQFFYPSSPNNIPPPHTLLLLLLLLLPPTPPSPLQAALREGVRGGGLPSRPSLSPATAEHHARDVVLRDKH